MRIRAGSRPCYRRNRATFTNAPFTTDELRSRRVLVSSPLVSLSRKLRPNVGFPASDKRVYTNRRARPFEDRAQKNRETSRLVQSIKSLLR